MSERYNGWANYETWCIGLWLDNDEGNYFAVRDMIRELKEDNQGKADRYDLTQALRAFVEDLPEADEVLSSASFVSDLLGAALSEVDWYELADHYLDKLAEEDDDETEEDDEELVP